MGRLADSADRQPANAFPPLVGCIQESVEHLRESDEQPSADQ
jgi:hypothetical protein